MQQLWDSIQANAGALAILGLVLATIAVIVAWIAVRHASRIRHAAASMPVLLGDPALDQILTGQMQRVDAIANEVASLGTRTRNVEVASRMAIQSAGLVRFNPFREDTGGNLSFALALLDADNNGIILSSLHSRQTTRVYIKAITGGQSDQPLSEEETAALRQARGELPSH
jgi:Protein of unknown function (DUF4446)